MTKRDMYNASGYLDMTAFLALKRIEEQERRQRALNKQKQKSTNTENKGVPNNHDK